MRDADAVALAYARQSLRDAGRSVSSTTAGGVAEVRSLSQTPDRLQNPAPSQPGERFSGECHADSGDDDDQ